MEEDTNVYFRWLLDCVDIEITEQFEYFRLMNALHSSEFTWDIRNDKNRASDGHELRSRFLDEHFLSYDYDNFPSFYCSVLEMLVGLARRCEDTLVRDYELGDRAGEWFWMMLRNLGLDGEVDTIFNKERVEQIIKRFLSHRYDANGLGGLFFIPDADRDLRKIEIWRQLSLFLIRNLSFDDYYI